MSDKTKRLADDAEQLRRFQQLQAATLPEPDLRCPCGNPAVLVLYEKAGPIFFCDGCGPGA